MDDEFFASVLKKWAYASQEVVNLKKRLGEVETERNEYQHEITELKARGNSRPVPKASPPPPSFDTLDLDEVEKKLDKARLEYQRRLQELENARSREDTLSREVEYLKRQLKQLVNDSRIQQTQPSSELSNLRLEKETMAIKICDLSRKLQDAESARTEFEAQASGVHEIGTRQVSNLQQQMTFLETQIHELQSLARSLETDNANLREELATACESLQKTKESNKSLMTTIGQLSRIARNVAGVPEQAPTGQHESLNTQPEGTATELLFPKALQVDPILKEEQKSGVDLSFNDVTVVEEPNDPTALISPRRIEALAALPVVILDSSINDDDNKFTRGFTNAGVASSIQSLLTRGASNADPPKKRHIEEYLCPRLDHNPWCPSTPGQHGYMFIASNKEKHIYATPKLRNLFVGLPKRSNKEERYFRYLGIYRVTCMDPLSAEEWKALPSTIKQNYAYTMKGKNKDPRTEAEIATAYDSGEASIPCVKLECVDFDEELYAGLLAIRIKRPTTPKSCLVKRKQDGSCDGSIHSQRTIKGSKKLPK